MIFSYAVRAVYVGKLQHVVAARFYPRVKSALGGTLREFTYPP